MAYSLAEHMKASLADMMGNPAEMMDFDADAVFPDIFEQMAELDVLREIEYEPHLEDPRDFGRISLADAFGLSSERK